MLIYNPILEISHKNRLKQVKQTLKLAWVDKHDYDNQLHCQMQLYSLVSLECVGRKLCEIVCQSPEASRPPYLFFKTLGGVLSKREIQDNSVTILSYFDNNA